MGAIPLPEGNNAADMIRRLRGIDAEFFGTLYAEAGVISGDVLIEGTLRLNDILSTNWDGDDPVDLGSGPDTGMTTGYALDASAGIMQVTQIFAAPGSLSTPALSYVEDASTGFFFFLSGAGPSGGDGGISATCSGGASWTLNNDASGPGTFGVIGHIHAAGGAGGKFKYTNLPTARTATSAVLWWNGTSYEIAPTSSTIRGKRDIRNRPQLANIELKPKKYIHKASGNEEYGLITEDLVEQDPRIGIWDDNVKRYDDYQDRAVIAILAAKGNKQKALLDEQGERLSGLEDALSALTERVAALELEAELI